MKDGRNEGQKIRSFSIVPILRTEESFDVIKIEYEDGSLWTLTSDEFDSIIKEKENEFDEEFLCIQHLVRLYFKDASAEFVKVFAEILKSYLNGDWHESMSNMMMEAGYRKGHKKYTNGVRYGWRPDKTEKLLSEKELEENKFLDDGSNEFGIYPKD